MSAATMYIFIEIMPIFSSSQGKYIIYESKGRIKKISICLRRLLSMNSGRLSADFLFTNENESRYYVFNDDH